MAKSKNILTQSDINLLISEMKSYFVTQDKYDEGQEKLITILDGIAKRISDLDQEYSVSNHTVNDLSERTYKLEQIIGLS